MKKKSGYDPIEDFKIYTRGMSSAQKCEYIMMSESDKTKIREKIISQDKKKDEIEQKRKRVEQDRQKEQYSNKHPTKDMQISVFVLNMRREPLMTCSPRKARILLESGKAKVIQRRPFTIQLNYATGETKQPVNLGLDSGYMFLGFSATTEKRELISGEVILRTDIPEKILEKKMYRRGRRNRNTRYREARFNNRKSSKPKGWLAPSIQHKLDSHVRLVNKIKKILPITSINIEVATFDTQKMQNPEISGIEYQQGTLQGYEIREYLLDKWGRKCVYCNKQDIPLEIDHIISRARGGSDRVSNLTIACHECNQRKGTLTAVEFGHPEIQLLAKRSLKGAAFMNIVRWKLVELIPGCYHTYGYITKHNRIKLGIERSHANDAFVIAVQSMTNSKECINKIIRSKLYQVKQIRRNNRALQLNRKGFKPSIKKKRYRYSPGDLITRKSSLQTTGWGEKANKKDIIIYIVKGVFNYGKWIRLSNPILGEEDININIEDGKILKYGSGLLFQLINQKQSLTTGKNNIVIKKMICKSMECEDTKQIEIDYAWR